jgi:hypothetical protein
MKLDTADSTDPDTWDAQVASLGGTIFHTSVWARYGTAVDANRSARYLRFLDDETVGVGLAFVSRSPHRLLGRLTGRLELEAMPALGRQARDDLCDVLRQVEAHARREGCAELAIGGMASPGREEALRDAGFEVVRRMEFELSLEPSEEELWRAMARKRRKNIKKAARSSVELEDMNTDGGAAELRRLQGASAERIVARGGRDIRYKGGPARDPVMELVNCGLGRIVVARLDGEVVSAGLFTCFNGLVYHTLSGHSREGLQVQAPTLLLWETIKRYRDEGARRLNFGGCKADAIEEGHPEHGIYEYKKAFGGECLPCPGGRKVLRKAAHMLVRGLKVLLRR